MKIFLDTADYETIKKWFETGLVQGVTTNPSHLFHAGGNPVEQVKKICDLLAPYDVSVEVTEKEPKAVYLQAKKIAELAPNVVVKIPCALEYYPVIYKLVKEQIPLNITLVFSVMQALMMAKLEVKYISPFVGRLNDIDSDGLAVVQQSCAMIKQYNFTAQILAASLRTVKDLHEVVMAGADVATVPVKILELATEHPLTAKGMAIFNEDWLKLGVKQFP